MERIGWARRTWQNTRSSLIAGLRRGDRKVAMPAFCDAYWSPIATFIAAKGCAPGDAGDVTQAFFASMMKPGFFASFDPARGRFRNWLRTAAKYFYFNSRRQGWREVVSAAPVTIDERLERQWDATSEPDRVFDRAVAETLARRALERLRRRYADDGQEALFSQLYLAVLGERRRSDDAAISKLVGKSISLLKKDRHEEKQAWTLRYQGCLREEIASLGVRRASIESVIADLLDASS
jgi:hypothetical protein